MKNGKFITAILSTAVLVFSLGCAEQNAPMTQTIHDAGSFKMSRRFDSITPDAIPTIQVFNQANQPIANAKILIGDSYGSPFKDNLMTTDENGFVAIKDWTIPSHITVEASRYIRQTLLTQTPGTLQIKLNPSYLNPRPVVKGQVTNIPVNNGDKNIDFALVIPTISKVELLNFDLGTVISPYTDTVDLVLGQQAELPSNVSLPTQKESYAFIPVTFSKPEHRVYALNYGPKTFFALTGRFPFKTVMKEMEDGKQFYEILNHFDFNSGGLREITLSSPNSQLNIPGNEIKFNTQVAVKGAAVQADEVVMTLMMNDLSGGRFVPSDVKRIEANKELKLNIMAGKPAFVVSLLKKAADFDQRTAAASDRSSASMIPYTPGLKTSLLPLMNAPVVSQVNGAFKIVIPESSNTTLDSQTINPLGVSISISDIKEVADGQKVVTMLNRKWEVLGVTWPTEVNLPAWPLDSTAKRKIEVNLIGSQTTGHADIGDGMIKAATHVTHAAAEL